MNPVAARELQERFRTLRSPLVLSLWVLAGGALTFLAYLFAQSAADGQLAGTFGGSAAAGSVVASSSMGRFMLHTLLLGMMTAVIIVVPGQSGVTIVGERERQTLPLLQVSQLSATRIVIGKLMSSLAFILLLLVVTTPLLVIPVLLGGVSIWDVVAGVGLVAATAVTVGAGSMWISARARSVQGAVLGSYLWGVALMVGTLALLVAEVLLLAPDELGATRYASGVPRDEGRELYTSWISPYIGLVDASSDVLEFRPEVVSSPYAPFRQVLVKRQGFGASAAAELYQFARAGSSDFDDVFFEPGFLSTNRLSDVSAFRTRTVDPIRGSVWWRTLTFEAIVTITSLLAATRLVKVPRSRTARFRRGTASAS